MLAPLKSSIRRLGSLVLTKSGFRRDPLPPKTLQNLMSMLVDPVLRLPEVDGEFFVDPRSDNFSRLIRHGVYEPELVSIVKSYLDSERDAIDVGANVGFFTCLLSKECRNGRVLACEPTSNARHLLTKNLKLNQLDNVIVFEGAVSDRIGSLELASIEGKEEYSSIGSISHANVQGIAHRIERVATSTIDDLVAVHQLDPCLIKIDVEGAEMLVLRGAFHTLQQRRPVIACELSDQLLVQKGSSKAEVVKYLHGLNYRTVCPYRLVEIDSTTCENEVLAIPE